MKKIIVGILCICMTIGLLTACGSGGGSAQKGEGYNILDDHTVKVAVLDFIWVDRSGEAMKLIGSYLEENFNCKFDYVTIDGTDAEAVISATENAITGGADIVMSTVAEGFEQAGKICEEAGAAFLYLNCTPRTTELSKVGSVDGFVGSVAPPADGTVVGKMVAETVIEEGRDNFLIVTFTPGLFEVLDQYSEGFISVCEEKGANIVASVEEMPGTAMTTAVSTSLETYGDQVGYICAFGGGTNFVAPALTAQNLSIPMCVPAIPTDYEEYYKTGMLDYIAGYSDDAMVLAFALAINYLNGTPMEMPENKVIECVPLVLRTLEETQKYEKMSYGTDGYDPTYNVEEIKSIINAYNPDATIDDLQYLADTMDLAGIIERHGE